MNRLLNILNFAGIFALAILCAVQWRHDSRLAAQVRDLDRTRAEQSAQLAEQGRTLKEDAADLEDLHQRLSLAESQMTQLTAERDALKTTLDRWKQAVAQRDDALTKAGEEIKKLAVERNDAIQKLNDAMK